MDTLCLPDTQTIMYTHCDEQLCRFDNFYLKSDNEDCEFARLPAINILHLSTCTVRYILDPHSSVVNVSSNAFAVNACSLLVLLTHLFCLERVLQAGQKRTTGAKSDSRSTEKRMHEVTLWATSCYYECVIAPTCSTRPVFAL